MANQIVIIGNSSIDNVVMSDGTFYQHICGGNSFHAAMAASIISENVAIVVNIPENFPLEYIDKLNKQGINTTLVHYEKKKVEWEELFIYKENGDRDDGIFVHLSEQIKKTKLKEKEISELTKECRSDVYTYQNFRSDFPPSVLRIPKDMDIISLHVAPSEKKSNLESLALNVPIKTFDPGRYLKGMEYDDIVELVSKATVFTPSKKELKLIFPNTSLFDAIKRIGRDCNIDVVCKNGGDGCLVYLKTQDRCFSISTFPSNVKDLTGAGDSFCGAFNACLADGDSIIDSARKATVVAAKAIENVSAVNRNMIDKSFVMINYQRIEVKEVSTYD